MYERVFLENEGFGHKCLGFDADWPTGRDWSSSLGWKFLDRNLFCRRVFLSLSPCAPNKSCWGGNKMRLLGEQNETHLFGFQGCTMLSPAGPGFEEAGA